MSSDNGFRVSEEQAAASAAAIIERWALLDQAFGELLAILDTLTMRGGAINDVLIASALTDIGGKAAAARAGLSASFERLGTRCPQYLAALDAVDSLTVN